MCFYAIFEKIDKIKRGKNNVNIFLLKAIFDRLLHTC